MNEFHMHIRFFQFPLDHVACGATADIAFEFIRSESSVV